jgi:predicted RNA methylase
MVVRGSDYERQDRDWYQTPAWVTELILKLHRWDKKICDPCCGDAAMTRVFAAHGHIPYGIDIKPLAEVGTTKKADYLESEFPFRGPMDIITNPPFGPQGKTAIQFIDRSLEVTKSWDGSVCMLLPVDFDSGSTRQRLFREHAAFIGKTTLLKRIKWFDEPVMCKPCSGSGSLPSGVQCRSCKGIGEKMVGPSNNHALFFWDWKYGRRLRAAEYAP